MADPAVVQVMNEFRQDLINREAQQFSEMAARWRHVEHSLDGQIALVIQQVNDLGGVATPGQLMRLDRYQALLRQLRAEVQNYAHAEEPRIAAEQRAYAEAGVSSAAQAIEASGAVRGSFNVLPIRAVENMVGLAGDGSPLYKLLSETWPDAAGAMTTTLIRSTALGINPRQTARDMQKATEGTLGRMLLIARCEQLRVFRTASLDAYRASGVVKQWRRLAAKQARTCVGCLAADGRIYDTDHMIDAHPACRCSLTPIVDGMPAIQWQTGEQWLAQQPEAVQLDVLGPARLDLWRTAAVSFGDFATTHHDDTWGGSIVPTPVQDLMQRIDKAA